MLDISVSEVFDFLFSLNCASSSGPDQTPLLFAIYFRRWALTKPIPHLYNLSLKSGTFNQRRMLSQIRHLNIEIWGSSVLVNIMDFVVLNLR